MARELSRRQILYLGGGALATASVAGAVTVLDSNWKVVTTPTDRDLNDVAFTAAGAYAVGDGGVALSRGSDGWSRVLDSGASGDGRDLRGATATSDGERLWAVGASGAIAEIDAKTGTVTDHSAPGDSTNDLRSVAVRGGAGDAAVWVADNAGKIHYSFENGANGTWQSVTPGSGASLPAIEFNANRAGHAVDTNGAVFATDDGETWAKIGVEDANVNFYGIDSDGQHAVHVVGGNGTILDYGERWTRTDVGDTRLADVELDGKGTVAVGDGGSVFVKGNKGWTRRASPTGTNLAAVATGKTDVAVGDGGVVIER